MAKRRIIIRESDFKLLRKSDLAKYESYEFKPFTRSFFDRRATYYALRSKQSYLADQYALADWPHVMISKLTQFKLHDRRYPQWLLRWQGEDLLIRAGLRQPESQLGYLTLVGEPAKGQLDKRKTI
jgi:hypothetical protein